MRQDLHEAISQSAQVVVVQIRRTFMAVGLSEKHLELRTPRTRYDKNVS